MKTETKEKFNTFITAVELLAQSVIHQAGVNNVTTIMKACEDLKQEIEREWEG